MEEGRGTSRLRLKTCKSRFRTRNLSAEANQGTCRSNSRWGLFGTVFSWARGNTRYHAVGTAGVTLTILAEARGESATTVGATGSSSNPQVDLFRFNFGCGTRPSTGRAARIESRR